MKRAELIEIGIIAVVLILGFRAFESILNVIIYTLYSFSDEFRRLGTYIWSNVISLALYSLGIFFLLKNRKDIASYIAGKNEENKNVSLYIQKSELLFIIIVALCIASILSELSTILIYVFDYFKNEVGGYKNGAPITEGTIRLSAFKTSAVKLVLTLVLLYFARPISNSLSKPQSSDLPIIETDNKTS